MGVLVIVGALGGCASNPWAKASWNPSNWLGGNLDQNEANAQASPDISHIHGPLAPPAPAPREPVQSAPLAPPPNMAAASAAPAAVPVNGKVKVALLLPLTGKNAPLGQAMLNAAQQAVFDVADRNFELMPRDTGAGDAGVETAARDAVASGAQLLIGPLFAANIPAARAVAQSAGLNMLTLSTDTTQAGAGVFVMGFTPGAQVVRVVRYAAAHGLRHFAALVPNTPYGALVGQAFQQAVARNGGAVTAFETYDPLKHDSGAHIRALAPARGRIDALFLPEGGGELDQIAAQLAAAGFDGRSVKWLGTGLWDVGNTTRLPGFIDGGWYASADPAMRQNFISTYARTYGQDPPRLATLAYDATALAAVLAKRGAPFDVASLTNPNGFAGLDGIFRLTPQGLVERGLAVDEVTPDGPRVIDPAPVTFAND